MRGATLPLRLSGPATCTTCGGLGRAAGHVPAALPDLRRLRASSAATRARSASASRAATAAAPGQLIDDPCPTATAPARRPRHARSTSASRPACATAAGSGWPARARPGSHGAPAGDLFVTVHVREHQLFGRSGDDLTLTVPITFAEAALGTTLRVPTLDGSVGAQGRRRARRPGARCGCAVAASRRKKRHGRPAGHRRGRRARSSSSAEAREALEKYAAAQPDDPRPQITAALDRSDAARATRRWREPAMAARRCRTRSPRTRRCSSSPSPPSSPACTPRRCASTTGSAW